MVYILHFTVPAAYVIGLNDGENSKLVGVALTKSLRGTARKTSGKKMPSSRGYMYVLFLIEISRL